MNRQLLKVEDSFEELLKNQILTVYSVTTVISLVTFVALYFIYDSDPINIPNQAERLRQTGLKSTSKSSKSTFDKAKIFIRSLIKIMMDKNYLCVWKWL